MKTSLMDGDLVVGFVPILGRLFYPKSFPQCESTIPFKWKVAYFVENVIAYFIVGFCASRFFGISSLRFGLMLAFVFPVVGYLEFRDMQKHPRRYSKYRFDKVSKREFFWLGYHAFWAMVTGYVLGGFL